MSQINLPKRKPVYKRETPCSELSHRIVEKFMVVCATPNTFFSEQQLRKQVDKTINDYFNEIMRLKEV